MSARVSLLVDSPAGVSPVGNRKKTTYSLFQSILKLKDKIKKDLFLLSGGFVEKGIRSHNNVDISLFSLVYTPRILQCGVLKNNLYRMTKDLEIFLW